LIRPADAGETAEAWRVAIAHADGPTAIVLTRQKLGFIDREKYAPAAGVVLGGYVLADSDKPQVVMMSSGSEVGLVMAAHEKLAAQGVRSRVVSVPSQELFARQSEQYRATVLPPGIPRLAVEAAHPMSWYRWVGDNGAVVGIERYGASAPYERIYEELGLTVDRVVDAAKRLI
jgi:transketolase